jgi:hypothetical protein
MPHRIRDTQNSSHANSRLKRDTAVDAAFVSSPDEGRGRLQPAAAAPVFIPRLYGAAAVHLDFLCLRLHLPIMMRRLRRNLRRSTMGILFTDMEKIGATADADAYRAWLISRMQSPAQVHSASMHMRRLRVLARHGWSRVSAALSMLHKAIVVAKTRRVQRELTFHGKELRNIPQRPLILGDKWDF